MPKIIKTTKAKQKKKQNPYTDQKQKRDKKSRQKCYKTKKIKKRGPQQ